MSGADDGPGWIGSLIDPASPYTGRTQRADLTNALKRLLICRIVLPSYQFLADYRRASRSLYTNVRATRRPDLFAVIESRAAEIDGTRARDIARSRRSPSWFCTRAGIWTSSPRRICWPTGPGTCATPTTAVASCWAGSRGAHRPD
jgi:hypothetical protein